MKTIIILCAIFLAILAPKAGFTTEPTREYYIKAGFIYKFLFFTDWPGEAFVTDDAPIIIGIVGENPFDGIFNKVEGKIVNGRRLSIKKFGQNEPIETLGQCQLLFISPSLQSNAERLLKSLKSFPVLTVTEGPESTDQNSMIYFVNTENIVAFVINRIEAQRVGITFRSRLLRLATEIIENNHLIE